MKDKHLANYHSHTYLCGHAGGSPIDYVKEALKHNFKEIGISEHAPMANLRNKNSRLHEYNYQTYHELLDEAKSFAKLNNINFYKGLEIEYFPHITVYEKYLKDLDYLILGQHYIIKNNKYKSSFGLSSLEDIIIYRDTVIKGLETGYFNMLCHPDLCFFNIKNPTDEQYEALRPIVKKAKELNIPLELNANGIRRAYLEDKVDISGYNNFRYPRTKFFEIVAEEGASVIISSDAHNVEALNDFSILESYKFAEKLNLKVINKLNMNYYK